jgi:hypothetical protein
MQSVFVTNADGCGDHVFTQIKRAGRVAIYSRTDVETNRVMGYEVVVITTVKAGTVYAKGAKPTEHDTESYPGCKSFGKSGWACATMGRAEEKFVEVVKNEQSKGVVESPIEGTQDIPAGEFTLIDFATVNCMPVNNVAVSLLQTLLKDGKVKLSKTVEKTPGRKIQWFVRV